MGPPIEQMNPRVISVFPAAATDNSYRRGQISCLRACSFKMDSEQRLIELKEQVQRVSVVLKSEENDS
jgi:hypothetical protein